MTAADRAKQRFENFLKERLSGEWDETVWEFYAWLLKQAKNHKPDHSGYINSEYKKDYELAKKESFK